MRWRKEYAIDIAAIDAQHRRLFEICGELEESLQAGLRSSVVRDVLDNLGTYAIRHFQLEEKYMNESGYPGLVEQQRAHEGFVGTLKPLQESFSQDGLTPSLVHTMRRELEQWLKEHVTGLDKAFGDYYRDWKARSG